MTRDILQTILRAAGVTQEKGVFRAPAEQRVTFYLGSDGRGLSVPQVEEIRLEETYLLLKTKETGQIFAEYSALYAVSTQPPKENAPNKAGFA
ncbi:MAG: hypothetical protein JWN04_1543 [Myxococcaceae bacterium]|nr:hypothetical protein [Myxococcaceae bacterium]